MAGTFADVSGQTNITFPLSIATEADFAAYRVVMQNATSTVTSAAVQVDVIKLPNTITFPTIASPTFGQTVNLNATASSNLPVS